MQCLIGPTLYVYIMIWKESISFMQKSHVLFTMLCCFELIIFIRACEFYFLQANDEWIQVKLDTKKEKDL